MARSTASMARTRSAFAVSRKLGADICGKGGGSFKGPRAEAGKAGRFFFPRLLSPRKFKRDAGGDDDFAGFYSNKGNESDRNGFLEVAQKDGQPREPAEEYNGFGQQGDGESGGECFRHSLFRAVSGQHNGGQKAEQESGGGSDEISGTSDGAGKDGQSGGALDEIEQNGGGGDLRPRQHPEKQDDEGLERGRNGEVWNLDFRRNGQRQRSANGEKRGAQKRSGGGGLREGVGGFHGKKRKVSGDKSGWGWGWVRVGWVGVGKANSTPFRRVAENLFPSRLFGEKAASDIILPHIPTPIKRTTDMIFNWMSRAAERREQIRRDAEQGNANAQNELGRMYATGKGVPQDYAMAKAWFLKAAEQGHVDAQFNLGQMYATGNYGIPPNHMEAEQWYRKAAEQGHSIAPKSLGVTQNNIGVMYARGDGVPRDNTEAFKWFTKSAEQGNADGKKHLRRILVGHMMAKEAEKK